MVGLYNLSFSAKAENPEFLWIPYQVRNDKYYLRGKSCFSTSLNRSIPLIS